MKIVVVGTGGLGGYYGALLLVAGADVSFIARGAQLEALRTRGLRIESPQGDLDLPTITATNDPTGPNFLCWAAVNAIDPHTHSVTVFGGLGLCVLWPKKPMVGSFACCARAASAHAAALPPSRAMNSRRFTAQYLPCLNERIAHLHTAGGCCDAGFQSGLCQLCRPPRS